MKWLYHFKSNWKEAAKKPLQTIHLRPTIVKDGEVMVGNIIKITIIAIEYYFKLEENPFDNNETNQIYFEKLASSDYHIVERDISEERDYLLLNIEVYLKTEEFDKEDVFYWVDKILLLHEFEKTELEESSFNDFIELNPIMRLFSLGNVKKFEDKLGKDWWKN